MTAKIYTHDTSKPFERGEEICSIVLNEKHSEFNKRLATSLIFNHKDQLQKQFNCGLIVKIGE